MSRAAKDTPEGLAPDLSGLFGPLEGLDPALFSAVVRQTARVVPQHFVDKNAALLERRMAAPVLDGLWRSGVRRVALAGPGPALDELLRSGILERFSLAGIYSAAGGEEIFAGAFGHQRARSLASLGRGEPARQADALLLTDGLNLSCLDQIPVGLRVAALPGLAQDRALRLFLPQTRREHAEHFALLEEQAARVLDEAFEPENTVLFAGVYAYFNFNRMSRALRARGLRTAFLCLNPSNTPFRDGAFDAVAHAGSDMELFYRLLCRHRYRVVHFQAWLGLHCFAAAACRLCPSPMAVEFNDIPQFVLAREDFDRAFGPGQFDREEAGVQTVLDHAGALILNAREEAAAELLNMAGSNRRAGIFSFHSYPDPAHFGPAHFGPEKAPAQPKGGPVRIGFAGSLNPSSHPDEVFGDVKLLGLITELTGQGLEFQLFFNPFQRPEPQGAFWDYFHLAERQPLFKLRHGVSPAALSGELAGLHYGSMLYRIPPGFRIRAEHFRHMMPTKLFSYLEAGLPVLVSEELLGVARLVRERGLGLVLAAKDLPRLAEILAGTDHAALRENVLAYRQEQSMPSMVGRLQDIYEHARAATSGAPSDRSPE